MKKTLATLTLLSVVAGCGADPATQARIGELEERRVAAEDQLARVEIRAPLSGIIHQLNVHTVGGVVTPAQPLMQIIPASAELEVEAMVLNRDIGFVREGQEAIIKVESFPFTKYGTITGTVRQVYKDAVEDQKTGLSYPSRVTMAKTVMDIDIQDRRTPAKLRCGFRDDARVV